MKTYDEKLNNNLNKTGEASKNISKLYRVDEIEVPDQSKREVHPCADLFPYMKDVEFNRLVQDIKKNGLQENIKLLDDQIIDGRNRFKACIAANVIPTFESIDSICDQQKSLEYVLSVNNHRRQLNASQRACVAALIATADSGAATQETAAKMMNVSLRSVATAVTVKKKGVSALFPCVQKGDLSISTAEKLTAYDADIQGQVLSLSKRKRSQRIRELEALNTGDVSKLQLKIKLAPKELEKFKSYAGDTDIQTWLIELANQYVSEQEVDNLKRA